MSIECTVCLEIIHSPKTLHCGHTFCSACVKLLTKDHTQVHCATCRHITPVPTGGLPKNVLLEMLIEERQTATSKRRLTEITTTAASEVAMCYSTTLLCVDCHNMHNTVELLSCVTCCTDCTFVMPLCLPCLSSKHQVGQEVSFSANS